MRVLRSGLCAVLAIAVLTAVIAAAPAVARRPAADCQPHGGKPCLLPFPDNRLTSSDKASVTGLRVNLPRAAMPINTKGVRVNPGPI